MNGELLKPVFASLKFDTLKLRVSDYFNEPYEKFSCSVLLRMFIQLNTVELNMLWWCEKGIRLEVILYVKKSLKIYFCPL